MRSPFGHTLLCGALFCACGGGKGAAPEAKPVPIEAAAKASPERAAPDPEPEVRDDRAEPSEPEPKSQAEDDRGEDGGGDGAEGADEQAVAKSSAPEAKPAKKTPSKSATPKRSSAPTPAKDDGSKELWKAKCKSCHGIDGKARTKTGKKMAIDDMTTPAWQKRFSNAQLRSATLNGLKREEDGIKQRMKGYRGKLTDEEINGLVRFMRKLKR